MPLSPNRFKVFSNLDRVIIWDTFHKLLTKFVRTEVLMVAEVNARVAQRAPICLCEAQAYVDLR
jgi:hypothetical protein